ncbi:hypothetical protein MRX96_025926 [Rhipicephalus microplus]
MGISTDASAISTVDIRLPPFSTVDLLLWFLQVATQITARCNCARQVRKEIPQKTPC